MDLKSKINEQAKLKQTHRYREKTNGHQRSRGGGGGLKGQGIKKYKSVVTK